MKLGKLLTLVFALLLLAGAPLAQAQSEPTVNQIYQTAEAGDLLKARSMIDQVLQKHPKSAKAHYVKAELAARQNDGATAQSELATADKLEPGLPFAKPQAVQALRAQVQRETSSTRSATRSAGGPGDYPAPAPASRGHGLSLGMLVVAGAVILGIIALLRTRRAMTVPPPAAGGMYRDDGYGPGTPPPYGQGGPGYGQPYGQPPGYGPQPGGYYPPPQQPSMGSTIARGIGTGLAVGAGAVAAEELGRRLFHHDNGTPGGFANEVPNQIGPDPAVNLNPDMGGQDFGIADNNQSWDDNNGGVADGGWDDNGGGGGGDDWNT